MGLKLPLANAKYVNFYNFQWDCSILTYLVCLDSELRITILLMYMLPIKPSVASDMVHVHKKLGGVQIFYFSHFNSMQKRKLQNQFEGKVLWSNLSLMGKYSHNKRSFGSQSLQTGL